MFFGWTKLRAFICTGICKAANVRQKILAFRGFGHKSNIVQHYLIVRDTHAAVLKDSWL